MDTVIKFGNVSKRYRISQKRRKITSDDANNVTNKTGSKNLMEIYMAALNF
jgi:hypothetical protein